MELDYVLSLIILENVMMTHYNIYIIVQFTPFVSFLSLKFKSPPTFFCLNFYIIFPSKSISTEVTNLGELRERYLLNLNTFLSQKKKKKILILFSSNNRDEKNYIHTKLVQELSNFAFMIP